ncbi:MAG: hypothetical protein HC827_11290 [Cyanobacteria bacterium RM1_2_2]|nr:hypothetical protein [Cyanobacteria bacterium RM1_2_2]
MLPDWQRVNRLLVACSFQHSMAAQQLEPAMHVLKQALPQNSITFLTTETTGYRLIDSPQSIAQAVVQETHQPLPVFNTFEVIEQLCNRTFDAAIFFTLPLHSCYTLAYICYFSGIPIRVGQSLEFGGTVLSLCVKPPIDFVSSANYHYIY